MTTWIDSLLNFIIPPAIIVFLAWILYLPFKKPLDALFAKIRDWKDNREESEVELNVNKYINYE